MPANAHQPFSAPDAGGNARMSRGGATADDGLLLAGDIGGTKTVLALVGEVDGAARIVAEAVFPSREYASLEAVVGAFRASHDGSVARAAFSVAGPVIGGTAQITNLPWCLDEARLADSLGAGEVLLVNDLQATAYAIPHLRPDQCTRLLGPEGDPDGVRAVVAVGTGLGEALLVPASHGFVALPTEGGHTDFAPRGPLQRRLLAHLERAQAHVSYETVCSGLG
ncbi:MAG TPA: glucokinase, partial [Longimicrobiaceae bacterium]|nr:glucokinase [Longimicrobiaceae bacterium]